MILAEPFDAMPSMYAFRFRFSLAHTPGYVDIACLLMPISKWLHLPCFDFGFELLNFDV